MASVNSTGSSTVSTVTTNFSNPPLNQLLNQITTIKLDRSNFLLWKNLALPILRSYKLEGHLSGNNPCPPQFIQSSATESGANTTPVEEGAASTERARGASGSVSTVAVVNPLYESWIAVDQLLLGWLYNSMTPEVATQVMGFENAQDMWAAINELFGVQSWAEEDYLRHVFHQCRKGSLKMADYLRVMKSHSDNLGQAGSSVTNRSLVSQVMLGLDEEYNPVVAMIQGKMNITWSELQAELLVFEKRLELQTNLKSSNLSFGSGASVNMANSKDSRSSRGQQNFSNNRQNHNYGRGGQRGRGYRGRGRGRGYGSFNNSKPICHVCGKVGHTALMCYQRFNKEFSGPSQAQNRGDNNVVRQGSQTQSSSQPTAFVANQNNNHFATSETVVDPSWYADNGASNHVTVDYNCIANSMEYEGQGYGQGAAERSA